MMKLPSWWSPAKETPQEPTPLGVSLETPNPLDNLIVKLVDSLTNHPTDWTAEDYVLVHTPSGVELWASDGEDYCGVYRPIRISREMLTRQHRKDLWKAMQVVAISRTSEMIDAAKVDAVFSKQDD